MIIIATAQILMVFNVSSLQVSIDGIVSSFNIPATMIGTAIVTYSLVVAGLIMLGARVGQIYGSRRVFRTAVALFGTAMLLKALSGGLVTLLLAQAIAGLAAAALVPLRQVARGSTLLTTAILNGVVSTAPLLTNDPVRKALKRQAQLTFEGFRSDACDRQDVATAYGRALDALSREALSERALGEAALSQSEVSGELLAAAPPQA